MVTVPSPLAPTCRFALGVTSIRACNQAAHKQSRVHTVILTSTHARKRACAHRGGRERGGDRARAETGESEKRREERERDIEIVHLFQPHRADHSARKQKSVTTLRELCGRGSRRFRAVCHTYLVDYVALSSDQRQHSDVSRHVCLGQWLLCAVHAVLAWKPYHNGGAA
jgi:hypothetical protein